MRGRFVARVVHGVNCAGAPVRPWCTIQSARAVLRKGGAWRGLRERCSARAVDDVNCSGASVRTVRIARGLRCESGAWCGVRRRSGARTVLNKKNAHEERTEKFKTRNEKRSWSRRRNVVVQRKRLSDIVVLAQTPDRPHRASMLRFFRAL